MAQSGRTPDHSPTDLRAQLEEKSAEVELLHEVLAGVAAASDMESMLQFISEVAIRVTGTHSASIYVFDQARRNLVLKAVHHAPDGVIGRVKLNIGEGITGWVAKELLPVALERDACDDPRFKRLPDLRDQQFQSFLSVPMVAQNEFIGVLNVKTREPHHYPPRAVRLLQSVAAQAGAAVQGMRLQESMRMQSTQLSAISEVSRTITSNLYLEEILQLIVAMTARTFQFKLCSIMLLDEERQELALKATTSRSRAYRSKPNLAVGESLAGRALQEGRVLTILDVKEAPDFRFPDLAEKEGLCSMVCIPLRSRERSIGVLNCYTSRPKVFSSEELEILQTVANQATVAIENAKLMVRSAIIQEMHHRVKNSLQTVASLLRIQLNRPVEGTVEDLLRESINRIISIAAVHDLLSREELDQVNLRQVAETILNLTGRSMLQPTHRVTMAVSGDDVLLPAGKATSMALVLNELIQNAVEHGLAGHDEGRIEVRVRRSDETVEIEVTNDGERLPSDFNPSASGSLGLQIIRAITHNDLGGRFALTSNGLTRATVTFSV
jgi:two-component sensor histidine kinase